MVWTDIFMALVFEKIFIKFQIDSFYSKDKFSECKNVFFQFLKLCTKFLKLSNLTCVTQFTPYLVFLLPVGNLLSKFRRTRVCRTTGWQKAVKKVRPAGVVTGVIFHLGKLTVKLVYCQWIVLVRVGAWLCRFLKPFLVVIESVFEVSQQRKLRRGEDRTSTVARRRDAKSKNQQKNVGRFSPGVRPRNRTPGPQDPAGFFQRI